MAPEQCERFRDVDHRSDIYSLGATLYQLLCGHAPFGEEGYETPLQKLTALATKPIPSIRERRDDVPTELATIVQRMLARNADDRYATAAEVAEALGPLAQGCDLLGLLSVTSRGMLAPDASSKTTQSHPRDAVVETQTPRTFGPRPADPPSDVTEEIGPLPQPEQSKPESEEKPFVVPPSGALH